MVIWSQLCRLCIELRLVHRYPMNVSLADAVFRQIMTTPGSLKTPDGSGHIRQGSFPPFDNHLCLGATRVLFSSFTLLWPGPFRHGICDSGLVHKERIAKPAVNGCVQVE